MKRRSVGTAPAGRAAGLLFIVMSVALMGCSREPAAISASASATTSGSAVSTPTASAATPPATSTAPTPTTTPAGVASGETRSPAPTGAFSLAATLARAGGTSLALTAWHGGFVLVASDSGIDRTSVLAWTSPDGETWSEASPTGLAGSYVTRLYPTADGRIVALGYVATGSGISDRLTSWITSDPGAWQEIDLGLPRFLATRDVAVGPLGVALVGVGRSADGSTNTYQLWLARDGLDWQLVNELSEEIDRAPYAIGVGPEGFVAVGAQNWFNVEGDEYLWATASSDGLTWYEAADEDGVRGAQSAQSVVPLGADWLTAPSRDWAGRDAGQDPVVIWRSPDGLAWAPTAEVDVAMEEGGAPLLIGDGTLAILVMTDGLAPGALTRLWLSRDGSTWEPMGVTAPNGVVRFTSAGARSVLAVQTGSGEIEIWTATRAP